jgi:DNA sulfur modification protein DndB
MAWLENIQVQEVLNKLYDGTVHLDNDGKKKSTRETKAINSLFNKYKKPEHRQNVSYEILDEFVKDGWDVRNETHNGKRRNLTRDKSSAEQFENDVWCMFYNVGIRYLNFDNQLTLPFEKNSQDHKQIDIFAVDTENKIVFLVECKASKKSTKRPFKTEIESLVSMKIGFTKSINQIFGNDYKVKMIFATRQYRITSDDEDARRLKKANIYHLDDNKFNYLQNIISNYATSSRYQFIGHIFKGEKISNETIKIPALNGKMGNQEYYMFSLEPSYLLQIGYVLHRVRANAEDSPTYQRMLLKSRLKKIGDYLNEGNHFFPNSVIINFNETKAVKVKFEPGENSSKTESSSRFGMVEIPMAFAIANIIDGQHRIYGYSASEFFKKDTIPVVAFINMTTEEQLEMFIDVNQNQKAITPDLIDTLQENLNWDNDNYDSRMLALKSSIIRVLGETQGYALSGQITQGGDTAPLKRIPFRDSLTNCGLIPKANKKSFKMETARSSLYDVNRDAQDRDVDTTMENARNKISRFINACYEFIADQYPDIFEESFNQNFIVSNKGTYAFIMIIGSLNNHLTENGEVSLKTNLKDRMEKMDKYLRALGDGILSIGDDEKNRMVGSDSKEGAAARTLWLFTYQDMINRAFSDYFTQGLKDWRERKDVALQDEASTLVKKIESKMKEVTISNLKKLFGETKDANGREPWEYQVGKIRTDCILRLEVKLQEEADTGSTPKGYAWTDFFNIIDYKTIFEDHWKKPAPEVDGFETFQELLAVDMGSHTGRVKVIGDNNRQNPIDQSRILKEKWLEGKESGKYPANSMWSPEPKSGHDYSWVSIFNSHRNNTAHSGSKDPKVGLTKDEVDFLRKIDRAIN